ncbi:hypothetical protein DXG03_001962 [Asterophora parasitica]|uniref:Uncharacterized protein n=1 Tax=Asterophora parasitica TaxID=117018 RepID=A0A9P7KCH6_9AGAR|nr:hypothetical protein DXG03_001962 [Asterophora parasitica]
MAGLCFGPVRTPPDNSTLTQFQHISTLLIIGTSKEMSMSGNAIALGYVTDAVITLIVSSHAHQADLNGKSSNAKPAKFHEECVANTAALVVDAAQNGSELLDGWMYARRVDFEQHLQDIITILNFLKNSRGVPDDERKEYTVKCVRFVHMRALPQIAARVHYAHHRWGQSPINLFSSFMHQFPEELPPDSIDVSVDLPPSGTTITYLGTMGLVGEPSDSPPRSTVFRITTDNLRTWIKCLTNIYGSVEQILLSDGRPRDDPLAEDEALNLILSMNRDWLESTAEHIRRYYGTITVWYNATATLAAQSTRTSSSSQVVRAIHITAAPASRTIGKEFEDDFLSRYKALRRVDATSFLDAQVVGSWRRANTIPVHSEAILMGAVCDSQIRSTANTPSK